MAAQLHLLQRLQIADCERRRARLLLGGIGPLVQRLEPGERLLGRRLLLVLSGVEGGEGEAEERGEHGHHRILRFPVEDGGRESTANQRSPSISSGLVVTMRTTSAFGSAPILITRSTMSFRLELLPASVPSSSRSEPSGKVRNVLPPSWTSPCSARFVRKKPSLMRMIFFFGRLRKTSFTMSSETWTPSAMTSV